MTRIALLSTIAGVLLASCGPSKRTRYARDTEVRGYDFTEYTQQGFLFTPESYNGRYQSIGSLQVIVWPEMRRQKQDKFDDPAEYTDWKAERLSPQVAIDSLHSRARSMGADAIVRFSAQRVTEEIQDGVRVGYKASGFAIDRQE